MENSRNNTLSILEDRDRESLNIIKRTDIDNASTVSEDQADQGVSRCYDDELTCSSRCSTTDWGDSGNESPRSPLLQEEPAQNNTEHRPAIIPWLHTCRLSIIAGVGKNLINFSISWACSFLPFKRLTRDLQIALIKSSWPELFVLNFVQYPSLTSLYDIIHASFLQLQVENVSTSSNANSTCLLANIVQNINSFGLGSIEFATLKVILLFSPERLSRLGPIVASELSLVQASALDGLQSYTTGKVKTKKAKIERLMRLNKILLLLPQLRSMTGHEIHDIFFSKCQPVSSIETLIESAMSLFFGHGIAGDQRRGNPPGLNLPGLEITQPNCRLPLRED